MDDYSAFRGGRHHRRALNALISIDRTVHCSARPDRVQTRPSGGQRCKSYPFVSRGDFDLKREDAVVHYGMNCVGIRVPR